MSTHMCNQKEVLEMSHDSHMMAIDVYVMGTCDENLTAPAVASTYIVMYSLFASN